MPLVIIEGSHQATAQLGVLNALDHPDQGEQCLVQVARARVGLVEHRHGFTTGAFRPSGADRGRQRCAIAFRPGAEHRAA
jgi:hypothetical protein